MDEGLTGLEIGGMVFAATILLIFGTALAVWAWYGRKRTIAWREIPKQIERSRKAREAAEAAAALPAATALKPPGGQVPTPRTGTAPQATSPVHRNPVRNWSAGNGVVTTDGPTAITGSRSVPPRGAHDTTSSGVAGRCATPTLNGGERPAAWTAPEALNRPTR